MQKINSKLPNIGTTIFATMSKMANDFNAINLSQGFPDFPVSEELINLVNYYMNKGANQYAPMPGLPALRNEVANVIGKTYNQKIDADSEITVTSGATEALFATITALISEGDEVILFDPAYDSYGPAVTLAGGKPVHLKLNPSDYSIDWAAVYKAVNSKTKAIIINSPHNPTGTSISEGDLHELEQLIIKYDDLFIISDEVYERIVFDHVTHQSVLKSNALRAKSIAVFSFGKTFHATGWKVGYCVAPESITDEIRKVHQFVTFSVNTPVQHAIAEYLKDENNYQNLGSFYQKKRDFFIDKLTGSRFEVLPCVGTYYQLLSYKKISDKSEMEMAEWLTQEHGVASIPTSPFYKEETDNQVLRFCFAKSEDTLNKAAKILCKI